jgi:N-methylhydantoinase A
VGPQSAGAKPGPACYGTGGVDATVTDCDLILGYIDADRFLGGRRSLDIELAREAVRTRLAEPLGISVDVAAAGVVRIVDSRMADLIRREVIKSGRSPSDFVVYAFGGAGPVHAVGYAQDLGVSSVVVSPFSPVLSAFGIASADLVHSRVVTRSYALPIAADVLDADLAQLEEELTEELARSGSNTPEFRRYATLRFRRQTTGEEIAIPWDRFSDERVEELAALFVAHVDNLYGTAVAYSGAGVDIIALRVDAVAAVDRPPLRSHPTATDGGLVTAIARRPAWFGSGFLDTPVYASDQLAPGNRLAGPAIVQSPLTTTVLPPTASLEVDRFLNLVIRP